MNDQDIREAADYVTPDIEPAYYNGSIVVLGGEVFLITGRSITWDGQVTYVLDPVDAPVVTLFDVFGVPYDGVATVTPRAGDTLYDVPELGLSPLLPQYLSPGRESDAGIYLRDPVQHAMVYENAAVSISVEGSTS